MNYLKIKASEELYLDELKFCPCVICEEKETCKIICKSFNLYVKAKTLNQREKYFDNFYRMVLLKSD